MRFNLKGTPLRAGVALCAIAVVGAACASDSGSGSDSEESPSNLSGEVVVSGSSTVEPISALVAEKFQTENPDVTISVDGPGTGDGFELFCAGETDVSDASRPIEAEEIDACEKSGIEFIELKVGIDGLSVITSAETQGIECLGFKDLYALLGPESEGFDTWAAANDLAKEIGAENDPYPDEPLTVTAPGEESGTYDSFVELVLESTAEEQGVPEEEWAPRPDYQSSPNDNVIIEGIGGSPFSLGWVGYAFYVENQESVAAIPIDGGDGNCVEPTEETIADGSYPIARDLFVYINAAKAEENAALAAFADFYLSEDGLASVGEVGYVPQPEDEMQTTIDAWENRETGTREG